MGEMKITGKSRGSRRSWMNSFRRMDRMAFIAALPARPPLLAAPSRHGAQARGIRDGEADQQQELVPEGREPGALEDDGPERDQEIPGRDEIGHGLDDGGHVPDREDEPGQDEGRQDRRQDGQEEGDLLGPGDRRDQDAPGPAPPMRNRTMARRRSEIAALDADAEEDPAQAEDEVGRAEGDHDVGDDLADDERRRPAGARPGSAPWSPAPSPGRWRRPSRSSG